MIKTILFDVDGVILIGNKFSFQYEHDFGLEKGVMTEFFTGVFQDCKRGKVDLKIALEPYLKKWKWNKSTDKFLEYWFPIEIKLNDLLLLEIKKLRKRGIICALATNQEKYRFEYLKKELDFGNKFDKIFCSCELGYLKPEQEFFQAIFDKLNSKKEEVLFVDHDEENVKAAKKFGFNAEIYRDVNIFRRSIERELGESNK